MREYLNLEFHDIEASLPFQYSLERVIDDFILLAVFVGNDFLPHLPDLHIHDNGLERLFETYKRVLPGMGGYMNEGGRIDMRRLQIVLDEMKIWEREVFEKEYADVNWYKGKQIKHVEEMEDARKRNRLGGSILSDKSFHADIIPPVMGSSYSASEDSLRGDQGIHPLASQECEQRQASSETEECARYAQHFPRSRSTIHNKSGGGTLLGGHLGRV